MKRILVISWDGATWDVLKPLVSRGLMPNLSTFMQKSFVSELESIIPPVTAAAWTSFMTGKNPSKHGIFDFRGFDSCSRQDYIANHSFCKSQTIWEILSQNKKRSIVLNLPFLFPCSSSKNIIVYGFDVPSSKSRFASSEEIDREIRNKWPCYYPALRLFNCELSRNDSWVKGYIDSAIDSISLREEVALYFGLKKEWDMLLVHFQELDYIQHFIWSRIQRVLNNEKEVLTEKIFQFFRELDNKFGKLINTFHDEETVIMLMSDHGFGSNPGTVFPNVILKNRGYLFQNSSSKSLQKWLEEKIIVFRERSAYFIFRKQRPLFLLIKHIVEFFGLLKHSLFPVSIPSLWIESQKKSLSIRDLNVDWSKTIAITAMGDTYGFVYINPEQAKDSVTYNKILERLKVLFLNSKESRSNKHIFKKALTFKEAYNTEKQDSTCPDLILIPQPGLSIFIDITARSFYDRGSTEGYHRTNGILAASGSQIKNTHFASLPKLIDIFPTILYLFNIDIPYDIDSSPIVDIFSKRIQYKISLRDSQKEPVRTVYSPQDAAEISQRLKSLGYL
ncbi:alkaline phosphatase family protein [Candidatus Omnitrophota bacterium]